MGVHVIYTGLLSDQQLHTHLLKGDTLTFAGLGQEWLSIEHQVERLGFEELYLVSQRGIKTGSTMVRPLSL